jgi:hypothetical protein
MNELSVKQTIYVVCTAFGMLAVMIAGLIFWAYDQPSCWDLHASEEQAIANCEN